jgi:hypothetical protein
LLKLSPTYRRYARVFSDKPRVLYFSTLMIVFRIPDMAGGKEIFCSVSRFIPKQFQFADYSQGIASARYNPVGSIAVYGSFSW